jgi:hypothetical protein
MTGEQLFTLIVAIVHSRKPEGVPTMIAVGAAEEIMKEAQDRWPSVSRRLTKRQPTHG